MTRRTGLALLALALALGALALTWVWRGSARDASGKLHAVEEFAAGAIPSDAITLVALRYCGSANGEGEQAS